MFWTVPLSIIRGFSLYTQQWYMSYRFADSLRAGWGRNVPSWSCSLCVQCKTPDDGQRNCPKRVEFYSKNKSEKLVHLVGFIITICHDARSPERQGKHHSELMCVFRENRYVCNGSSCHGWSNCILFSTV